MSSDMLTAALSYAQRGWLVLPLHTPSGDGCSCKRGPGCTAVGKHPRTRSGLMDATTDESQIRNWWLQWPDANVGILTGGRSDLLVVDVDNKCGKRGSDNLAALADGFGGLPTTLTATTGGGIHLFFKHPGGTVKNGISKVADGVDVRSEGGYVVAAPSLHANGKRYAFTNLEQPLAEVPDWLLARMTTKRENTTRAEEEHNPFADAEIVHEGKRNATVFKLGCALRGQQGMEHDEIVAILSEYNAAKCDPPLDESEVLAAADSACKHPAEVAAKKSAKRIEQNPLYWFPFNTRDWFADQNLALMDDKQTGWYIRLKAFAWDKGGFLPADRNKLWKLAKAKSKKTFERDCDLVLAEYVEVDVDGERKLRNPAMAVEYTNTLDLWRKKRDAGEASKAARLAAHHVRQATDEAATSGPTTVQ